MSQGQERLFEVGRPGPSVLVAVQADIQLMRGMETSPGREGLMALAERLAAEVDGALMAGDSLDVTRLTRELRAVLAQLGRPAGLDADDDFLAALSAPVRDASPA